MYVGIAYDDDQLKTLRTYLVFNDLSNLTM